MNLPVKYRPKTFDDVVGQEHVVKTLKNALKHKKISNAYLFTGQRGVGKTTVARILAKGLNCEKGPTPFPCGRCEMCKEIETGNSLDVIEIDGASNRGIDQIRELRENVRFMPVKARYKVIIIDEVHMLTNEAFNALLKTLEEPPENVVFIFATTEPRKIPETVLSRVQRFDFRPLSEKAVVERLKHICQNEHIKCEEEALSLIYEASEGSMRDAISLLEQAYIYGEGEIKAKTLREVLGILEEEIFLNLFKYIQEENSKSVIELLRNVLNKGYSLYDFHKGLIKATYKLMEASLFGYSNDYTDLVKYFSEQDILYIFAILKEMEQVLRLSNYPRALFEYELLKLANLKKIVPLKAAQIISNYAQQNDREKEDTGFSIQKNTSSSSKTELFEELIEKLKLKEVSNNGSVQINE